MRFCSPLKVCTKRLVRKLPANSGSAVCFDTTVLPHEFLDPTGSVRCDGTTCMSCTQNMAEVGIGEADVRHIVQEQRRPAALDETADGLSLFRLDPKL